MLANYLSLEDEEDLNHFTRICLLKFFLSEGEKIMISYMALASSGISDEAAELALISNLISIVCRFIFHPLEEVGLNLFAKLEETQSTDVLAKYLAGVVGIGVSAAVFAEINAMEFLQLIYTDKWATESTCGFMRAYCRYLIFMALNGMSEAFAYGRANQTVLLSL
jgi:oligosaccharide translocation protein RFT1